MTAGSAIAPLIIRFFDTDQTRARCLHERGAPRKNRWRLPAPWVVTGRDRSATTKTFPNLSPPEIFQKNPSVQPLLTKKLKCCFIPDGLAPQVGANTFSPDGRRPMLVGRTGQIPALFIPGFDQAIDFSLRQILKSYD
jgi:hypothetical protein